MAIPNIIPCGSCDLIPVNSNNARFIESLFQQNDVKKFYILRADHAANIKAFCQYIISANAQRTAMNFIMFNNVGDEVGFISAEPAVNDATNMPTWNVAYAVHPSHRRHGYASDALNGLTNFLLQNFSFQQVMLDISEDNHHSIKVAQKCGFTKPNYKIGYIDTEHPEIGMRMKWFKQLAGQRTPYFNQAAQYFRLKHYGESIEAFKQALNEPYQPGTPYTNAQIYSNMGMAFSSAKQYREAFQCLKKAQSLGLNNASIEKELLWLKNNIGLY